MSGDKITWLHISDIHTHTDGIDSQDQEWLLDQLIDTDLPQVLKEYGLRINLVICTGDSSDKGDPKEYERASEYFQRILDVVGLQTTDLILVPGNHDINRPKVQLITKLLRNELSRTEDEHALRSTVYDALKDQNTRNLIFMGLEDYGQFANKYLVDGTSFRPDKYFYTRSVNVGGSTIAFLALNSAWLCYDDDDENKILLGREQVQTALKEAGNADVKILVVHHPFEWLNKYDQLNVRSLLESNCTYILHGHLHSPAVEAQKQPDSEFQYFKAGPVFEKLNTRNTYNIVELDFAQCQGQVILREWINRKGGYWKKDTTTYRDVDGQYPFPLPKKLCNHRGDLLTEAESTERQISVRLPADFVPNARSILLQRVDAVQTQLEGMISKLSTRLDFCSAIEHLRRETDRLLDKDVRELRRMLQHVDNVSSIHWTLIQSIEKDARSLIADILDCGQANEMEEVCIWGNLFLKELGTLIGEIKPCICVLSDRTGLGTSSRLVRLPIVHDGLWSLPLLAYQYTLRLMITESTALLTSISEPDESRAIPVLVADMLATHFCGPSYVLASTVLGHNPGEPITYPSAQTRYSYMVQTLTRGRVYSSELAWIEHVLLQKSHDPSEHLSTQRQDLLNHFDTLYEHVIRGETVVSVNHAQMKKNALDLYDYMRKRTVDTSLKFSSIDILNAAWYGRILSGSMPPEEQALLKSDYEKLFQMWVQNQTMPR